MDQNYTQVFTGGAAPIKSQGTSLTLQNLQQAYSSLSSWQSSNFPYTSYATTTYASAGTIPYYQSNGTGETIRFTEPKEAQSRGTIKIMVEEQNIKPTERIEPKPIPPEPQLSPEDIERWLAQKGSVPKAVRKQIALIRRQRRLKDKKIVRVQREDRMEAFLEEFIKNGGNATQAALAIGNHKTIQSAGVAGHNYLKKAKGLARIYLEKKGYSYGKLLDVAMEKMATSKTPDWWDRLMKMADYADFMSKRETRPAVVNVIQAQKDLQRQFGFTDGEIIEGEEPAYGDEEL